MDNHTPNWIKVAEDAPMALLHPLRNWVQGDHGWFNLDKFVSIGIKETIDSSYEASDTRKKWAICGHDGGETTYYIKTYVRKEKAYEYLGKVMGGLN